MLSVNTCLQWKPWSYSQLLFYALAFLTILFLVLFPPSSSPNLLLPLIACTDKSRIKSTCCWMVWSANKNACRHRHVNQFTSIKWGIVPSVNQHLNFLLPHFQTINCFSSDLIERLVKLRERCNQNHQFDSVLFANCGLFWSNPANLYKQSISRQGKKEGSSDFKFCRWCSFGPQQVRALKEPNLPAADQPIICGSENL